MAKGISTCDRISPQAGCLKNAGLDFVFRYYSTSGWKRMDEQEAIALAAAGLNIAVVYEDGPRESNADKYFTKERGKRHGENAYQWASDVIHQPKGSAIYFAVDYDYTDQANLDGIEAYFRAVRDKIKEQSGGNGTPDYKIGVYGSGKVCRLIKEQLGLAQYSWLAESTAWNGSAEYSAQCDVLQAIRQTSFCRLRNYEDCVAGGDFGSFSLPIDDLHPSLRKLVGLRPKGAGRGVKAGRRSSRSA